MRTCVYLIRHCERSEAIPRAARKNAGLFRCARNDDLLNMHIIPATRFARGLAVSSRPLRKEGAGKAGCALHPRSRVQYKQEVRTRAYRAAESIRHSLRNGFTAYSALSPVIGFLATVIGGLTHRLDASTEASGPHVFAVRFSRARHSQQPRPSQPVPRS